jgi:hypothetical protein
MMQVEAGHGPARTAKGRSLSHFMSPDAVGALLRERHGVAKAQTVVLRKQREARRARSRRRFKFWVEVASLIDAAAPPHTG